MSLKSLVITVTKKIILPLTVLTGQKTSYSHDDLYIGNYKHKG